MASQSPPFGGLHDVRLLVRRAAIGAMLTAEQLLEVADTLNCTGNVLPLPDAARRSSSHG